ncbi:MAG: sensor histidine kinase [Dissulfurimicrobium sp.]|uniref:sensor histidine kinase n=1 Tax=Dissulfurimicrobium sp. TaxID=2022436 RepID=UPI00404A95BF
MYYCMAAGALLVALVILWLWRFLKSCNGLQKTYAPLRGIAPGLLEKFLPYLSLEEVRNDPLKAIIGLADIATKQDAEIKVLNAVLQEIDEGVLLTGSHAEINFVNHRLLNMLNLPDGYSPDKWLGRDVQCLVRTPQIISILKTTDDFREQDISIRITQNDRELDVTLRKMDGPGGAQFLMIFRDVTALIRLRQTARDLVANVAHQLRTPLTSIKGYAETLLDQGSIDQETSRRFLTVILKNADRLTGLVRDILILAQLDGIDGLKDAKTVRLKDVILKAIDAAAPLSEEKGIRLITRFPEEEIFVKGVFSGLEQAVVNLLDNAIKYTGANTTVTVTLEKKERDVLLSVSDEGPGIPHEALDKVFERFYRLERDRTGGTGLGLSIVRQVAHIHKGRVWVESQLGKGATFYIAIPVFLPDSS